MMPNTINDLLLKMPYTFTEDEKEEIRRKKISSELSKKIETRIAFPYHNRMSILGYFIVQLYKTEDFIGIINYLTTNADFISMENAKENCDILDEFTKYDEEIRKIEDGEE